MARRHWRRDLEGPAELAIQAGQEALQQQQWPRALDHFRQASAADAGNPCALVFLGLTLERLRRPDLAQQAFERAAAQGKGELGPGLEHLRIQPWPQHLTPQVHGGASLALAQLAPGHQAAGRQQRMAISPPCSGQPGAVAQQQQPLDAGRLTSPASPGSARRPRW